MRLVEPHQQRCKLEVPVLLLQLTDPLPRQTLGMAQALPALQFSQVASRVFHELDRQVLLSRALTKLTVRVDITHVLSIHQK
jgi:hypothetical protein